MAFIVRTVLFAAALATIPSQAAAIAHVCWRPPADVWVVDPFREPPCPWCAGNRGIDFGVAGVQQVRAVEGGTVTFAGSVAGTSYVVVQHANGWKVTYGKLQKVTARRGDVVVSGAVVGVALDRLFFGLRVEGVYRDPDPYLGQLRGRSRLIPTDGSEARQPPLPALVCGR